MIPCFLLISLAGFYSCETPPADTDSALSTLSTLMISSSPEELGMFFAEIGLEASPDEVILWENSDFFDLVMDFSPLTPDSGVPDSLFPLVNSLPLHLLEKSSGEPVSIRYGRNTHSLAHDAERILHLGGVLQPA